MVRLGNFLEILRSVWRGGLARWLLRGVAIVILVVVAYILLLLILERLSTKWYENFDEGTHYGLTIGDSRSEVITSLENEFGDIRIMARPSLDSSNWGNPIRLLELKDDPSLLNSSPHWVWWPNTVPIHSLTISFTGDKLTHIRVARQRIKLM